MKAKTEYRPGKGVAVVWSEMSGEWWVFILESVWATLKTRKEVNSWFADHGLKYEIEV